MKKILLTILCVLLAYLLFNKYAVQFVWVNPNVNTKVFPYISQAMREIDNALNYSILSMRSSQYDISIKYRNAYGSGFLKNNPIPNDLDYSIGVYLGKYEYDGSNADEIARSIDEKMSVFQTEFYNYIDTIAPGKFYSNFDALSSIQLLYAKRDSNIKAISESIPKLFEHKEYVVYTKKTLVDPNNNKTQMTFPFVLKDNEILIEDYSPLELFSPIVRYSKDTRDMLREVTVVTDFYVDIKNNDDVVNAEIVAESFTGQRLQLTRRFFVPIVFSGNSSARYLKHLSLVQDKEKYIEYRMFNFKRHLQEFSNLKELQDRPIKLFKRVLQCTDLALPLLDENTVEEITQTIKENLDKPEIQILNDYKTAYANLTDIASKPKLYLNAQLNNLIMMHIDSMTNMIEDMKAIDNYDKELVEIMQTNTEAIKEHAKRVNSEERLKEFKIDLKERSVEVNTVINDKIVELTTDMDKILAYITTFNKMMNMAGFHKIDVCWLDKDLMGVVKDDFTKSIPEKELKTMAKENNLTDVDYKFIDASQLAGPKVRYSLWVRYKPSEQEEKTWQEMRTQLLNDKKNFRIKRRFTFPITF